GYRRDRRDVEGDPPRLLLHDLPAERVAGPGAAEHGPGVVGRSQLRLDPVGREARGEGRDRRRTRVDLVVPSGREEGDLPGGAVATAVRLAAEHESGAEAGTDREEDEVVDSPGDAQPLLSAGGEVDVVVESDR